MHGSMFVDPPTSLHLQCLLGNPSALFYPRHAPENRAKLMMYKYACMKLDIIKLNFLKETYSILSTLSEQIFHTWLCSGNNMKTLYSVIPWTNFTPISAFIGLLNIVYCKYLSTLGDFHPINISWGLCMGIQFFWQCNIV